MRDEVVNGVIIGRMMHHYEFWTTRPFYPCYLPPYSFADGDFEADNDAEEWVRQHHPSEYAAGVEMRAFD